MGFPGGAMVKIPPAKAGDARDAGSAPGSGRSPGAGNGNPLSILAWKIPWTEEPGWLQYMGFQRVGRHKHTHRHTDTQTHRHTDTHTDIPCNVYSIVSNSHMV